MKAVTLTIDGKRIHAAAGTTILEAARKSGIEIPTLCYHPRLRPLGHCRLCVVEVEGVAAPVTSCDNLVQEGMVVTTSTPRLEAIRKEIITLMLRDHPYEDCLTCEKTGACDLQERAYTCQVELPEIIRALPVTCDDNPYIVRDEAKCVLCGRCLRVCRDYAGRNVFALLSGGIESRITPAHEGGAVGLEDAGCIFCGLCVDVCPVGALTERDRGAAGREWDLHNYRGLCLECSLGCPVERSFAGARLARVRGAGGGGFGGGAAGGGAAGGGAEAGGGWICRKGKFNPAAAEGNGPVTAPLLRGEGGFHEVSYERALREAGYAFLELKKKRGPAALAVIAGGRCSNEESYLLQKLARGAMGTPHVDLGVNLAWAEAFSALEKITGRGAGGPSPDDFMGAKSIFVLGSGLYDTNPVVAMAVEQACRLGSAALVQVSPGGRELDAWERLVLQPEAGAEGDLFRALAALIKGEAGAEMAAPAPAGLEEADLARAARLLADGRNVILVCPSFFEKAGGSWIEALLETVQAAGQVERGRSGVLFLAVEGNARGILETGGVPGLLPGSAPPEGKAGEAYNRKQIADAVEAGEIKGLFAVLEGLEDPLPAGLEYLVVQCASRSAVPAEANVVFPAPPLHLKEGAFTSSAGEQQQNLAAPGAAGEIWPEWRVIAALAEAMGDASASAYGTLQEVQEEIRRVVEGR